MQVGCSAALGARPKPGLAPRLTRLSAPGALVSSARGCRYREGRAAAADRRRRAQSRSPLGRLPPYTPRRRVCPVRPAARAAVPGRLAAGACRIPPRLAPVCQCAAARPLAARYRRVACRPRLQVAGLEIETPKAVWRAACASSNDG